MEIDQVIYFEWHFTNDAHTVHSCYQYFHFWVLCYSTDVNNFSRFVSYCLKNQFIVIKPVRTFFWIEHYNNKVQVCVPRIHSPQRFQLSSFEAISGIVALLEWNDFLSVFVTKSIGVGLKCWVLWVQLQTQKFSRSLKSIQPWWIKWQQRQERYKKVQNNLGNPK